MRPMRTLIVDDERLARARLTRLLRRREDIELVGAATDGDEAVLMIAGLEPDLVFLDVQMPGKTGLDVVRDVGVDAMPATIFVTAFDQYALRAFELAALDYLVKPFDDERFESAFARARQRLSAEGMQQLREHLLSVLQGSSAAAPQPPSPSPPPYLERIAVEMRGKVRSIPVEQIDYIVADGPYAELHTGDRRHVIRESMQTLEDRLDPKKFMRIHRSMIVRLDLVDTLHRGAGGDYEVQLKNGARVKVSRSRREALERWLGVSS